MLSTLLKGEGATFAGVTLGRAEICIVGVAVGVAALIVELSGTCVGGRVSDEVVGVGVTFGVVDSNAVCGLLIVVKVGAAGLVVD